MQDCDKMTYQCHPSHPPKLLRLSTELSHRRARTTIEPKSISQAREGEVEITYLGRAIAMRLMWRAQ